MPGRASIKTLNFCGTFEFACSQTLPEAPWESLWVSGGRKDSAAPISQAEVVQEDNEQLFVPHQSCESQDFIK